MYSTNRKFPLRPTTGDHGVIYVMISKRQLPWVRDLGFFDFLKTSESPTFDQEVIITGQERTQQAQLKYKSFGFENQSFSLKIQEHILVSERNAYQYMVVRVT